jgi:hypothetical protein
MPRNYPEIRRGKAESGKLKTEIGTLHVERPETAESRCDFILQDADVELLMRQECPEIEGGGGGPEVGVKAVEDYRSPRPGGITERREEGEHHWALRRGLNQADGGLIGMLEMPESRCSFILYDADGELLMRRECPEIRRRKAEIGKLKTEIGILHVKRPEMAESRCGFVLHDADGEWLMRRDCPEFSSRVGGVRAGIRGQMAEVRGQCENSGRCAPVRRCVDADVRIRNKTRV